MKRRSFLKSLAAASGAAMAGVPRAEAALGKAKITRVRIYEPPNVNRLFNQSNMLITVETDIGITGTGEGGSKDTLEQCAGTLIGKNPFKIEQIWQEMFMAWFYPPGREKIHALGAMDLALWDIKGKALKAPVHELLGGTVRDYCDCYATGGVRPAAAPGAQVSLGDRARATLEAGYRVFRMGAGDTREGGVFDTRERIRQIAQDSKAVREAVGRNGEWMIDFHQRFDYSDALRGCKLLEEYDPFLVEDPVRDEHALEDLPKLRRMTSVPLAHGEEWGHRWDFNKLVENHDIDYLRATLPSVGGITEWMKISALCETHSVGIVPHFTGPVATAALLNCLSTFPGPVLFEYNYGDRPIAYLPEFLDFRKGKLYTNDRPGLGVTLELKPLKLIGEVTEPGRRSIYVRPDGSLTHW
jgi:L-alanine-DL-glutamate epimerase-like enolase superfamily enzyme